MSEHNLIQCCWHKVENQDPFSAIKSECCICHQTAFLSPDFLETKTVKSLPCKRQAATKEKASAQSNT